MKRGDPIPFTQGVAKIVVAVPVGAPETCQQLDSEVDEVICAFMPAFFHGVGQFYGDFSQTSDEEVRELLAKAKDQPFSDLPS